MGAKTPEDRDRHFRSVRRVAAVLALLAAHACGGGDDLDPAGRVGGIVQAPDGAIAQGRGLAERFASLWAAPARALTGVEPVVNTEVRLELVDGGGNVVDELTSVQTDGNGAYSFALASDEKPGSGIIVSAGSEDTLMRAFVYGESVNIDSASEAAVRLILASGDPLANFSADEIAGIQAEVDQATADLSAGGSIAIANDRAETRADADAGVRDAIASAGAAA